MQVLIVENDDGARRTVALRLLEAGFGVLEAPSGEHAVACIESGPPIDIVVTEIETIGSVDGWDVVRRFRAKYPGKPVIYIADAAVSHRLATGSLFIRKPYHPEDIVSGIEALTVRKPTLGRERHAGEC